VFDYKILLGSLGFLSVKESLSECLLLAAVAEVPVRTVPLPNLSVVQVVHRARVCWFCSDCCWSL